MVEADCALVLSRDLLRQTHLRVLKLSRLRIIALLPGQLSNETVSEPDEKD